jgi:hypothetical protein
MRKLIGRLVAARGAEGAVARKFVDSSPQFRRDQFLCRHALFSHVPAGSDLGGVPSRGPKTVILAGKDRTVAAWGGLAGVILPGALG